MSSKTPALRKALSRLAAGHHLSAAEAEEAFTEIMEGRADDIQKSGLLMGLKAKGETPEEVAGGVRALKKAVIPVDSADPDALVDTAGTGGGKGLTTFNISTAAAFVVAGAGIPVGKHGNRSHTSRCGSADVLEALGVNIDLAPERMAEILDEVGITFMYAPALHPAMKHVAPVRKALGVPTIMNILGPLTNPAGARRQVVGVSDPSLIPLIAEALADLGHIRALVVHGQPGMDEITPLGRTQMVLVEDGKRTEMTLHASELLDEEVDPADLAGGDPEENAEVVMDVLAGRGQPGARAAVALNAAGGLVVGGVADTMEDAFELANELLTSGKGLAVLESLRESSHRTD